MSSSQNQNEGARKDIPFMTHIENNLKVMFFPSIFFMGGFITKLIAFVVCVMAIIRNYGKPAGFKLDDLKAYAQKAFPSEFFTNIIFIISLTIASNSIVFYLPLCIHFLSGIAEYMISSQHGLYIKVQKARQIFDLIKLNRNVLLLEKQKIEIYLFFYSIVGIFLGTTNIMQVILSIQYLGIKNKFNQKMIQANNEIQQKINSFADGKPAIVKLILTKFIWAYNKAINLF